MENLEDLLVGLHTFSTRSESSLEGYLTKLMLSRSEQGQDKPRDEVTLMTLHSSKGLEFPGVFLVGFEECFLPHEQSMDDPKGLSEERRLAYVGLTRAKELLCITNARQRSKFGKKIPREPSRFLREIPSNLLAAHNAQQTSTMQNVQDKRNDKYMDMLRNMGLLNKK
jgi:superfamily I DNA/RNA helicase